MKGKFLLLPLLALFTALCLRQVMRLEDEMSVKEEEVFKLKILLAKEIKANVKSGQRVSQGELYKTLLELGVRFPHIVVAQARLETGNFTSRIFKESNNLFGMKVAKRRLTTAVCKSRGHAKYMSWQLSAIDYALFQTSFMRDIDNEREYFSYLARNYASDPKYVQKLKQLIITQNLN